MDAERVAHRVHTLCSTIEALGQELQEAHATIDLMAQTALDREQEIARLREALEEALDLLMCWHPRNPELDKRIKQARIEMFALKGANNEHL